MKRLWTWLWRGAVILVLLLVARQSPLFWPEPFFPYCAIQGRLSLCSDRSFNQAHARRLLSDVAVRLARSPLDDRLEHRIFISNTAWRTSLFMGSSGAAAFSINHWSRNTFTRHADIDANILFHAAGDPAKPPRTLTYYMTHEITHALIGEHVGMAQSGNMPVWIKEGYPDYVGMGSGGPDDDPDILYRQYLAHEPIFDAADRSYYRYRMLTAYFLQSRGWSVDRLLASTLTTDQAQHQMDQDPARFLK